MKRTVSLLLALVLLLTLCGCGKKGSGAAWQEQYDLGVRYLSDGNYEEAIIAFTAAIEIDPKRAEGYTGRGSAYLGMAEVYIARKQFDEAMEILRQGVEKTGDQRLTDRLSELEDGNIADYWGRTLKETRYDGNGALTCWFEYDYNDLGQCTDITSYGPDGSQIQHIEQRYDEQGNTLYGVYGLFDDGSILGATFTYNSTGDCEKWILDSGESITLTYDAEGRCVRKDFYYDKTGALTNYETTEYGDNYVRYSNYDADGMLWGYYVHIFNEQEQCVKAESYDANGILTDYSIYVYDDEGNQIAREHYDADGVLTGRDVYI